MGWFAGASAGAAGTVAVSYAVAAAGGATAAGISGGTVAAIAIVTSAITVLGLSALVMHKDYTLDVVVNENWTLV